MDKKIQINGPRLYKIAAIVLFLIAIAVVSQSLIANWQRKSLIGQLQTTVAKTDKRDSKKLSYILFQHKEAVQSLAHPILNLTSTKTRALDGGDQESEWCEYLWSEFLRALEADVTPIYTEYNADPIIIDSRDYLNLLTNYLSASDCAL